MDAAGGGGYGDPVERDAEMVMKDFLNGHISLKGARENYGVVIDQETMKVDINETERLRESLKKV